MTWQDVAALAVVALAALYVLRRLLGRPRRKRRIDVPVSRLRKK